MEKKYVYVLSCDSTHDYEVSTSVRAFDSEDKALQALKDAYASEKVFWDEDEDVNVFEEPAKHLYGSYSASIYEDGDYTKNHIEWEIERVEVEQ